MDRGTLLAGAAGSIAVAPAAGAAATYAGRYIAAGGSGIDMVSRGDAPVLRAGGAEGRLMAAGDVLATDHPRFRDAMLDVAREH